jgi:hypothetical protein
VTTKVVSMEREGFEYAIPANYFFPNVPQLEAQYFNKF